MYFTALGKPFEMTSPVVGTEEKNRKLRANYKGLLWTTIIGVVLFLSSVCFLVHSSLTTYFDNRGSIIMFLFDVIVLVSAMMYVIGTYVYIQLYPAYKLSDVNTTFDIYCALYAKIFWWKITETLIAVFAGFFVGAWGIAAVIFCGSYAFWGWYKDVSPKDSKEIYKFFLTIDYIMDHHNSWPTFGNASSSLKYPNTEDKPTYEKKLSTVMKIMSNCDYRYLLSLAVARVAGQIVF